MKLDLSMKHGEMKSVDRKLREETEEKVQIIEWGKVNSKRREVLPNQQTKPSD